MKRLFTNLVLAVLVLSMFSCSKSENTDSDGLKRYDVKSGIIHYEITISGNNGAGIIQGEGVQDLYFKNWGALELNNEEKNETITISIPGVPKKVINNSYHNTEKIDNENLYSVDYENTVIYYRKDPLAEFMRTNKLSALEAGRKMMLSMGGEQLENEQYKGYDCEVWLTMGVKQWIYKGVCLKTVSTIGNMVINVFATDIKFNIDVDSKYFNLPNYNIQSSQE
ncbi:hypothetical protein E0494_09435 [Marinilabiliaceae bacterium JC040]|nr:hypothetical protein [Marinilabiliaceae bacterium JC040]